MKRQRNGSALIITILLITVIATVSFAISALTIAELRKTAVLQDSIAAFYSAEAGIEHGLMQYRLAHNAQLSQQYYTAFHRIQNDPPTQSEIQTLEDGSPTEQAGSPQPYSLDGGADNQPKFARNSSEYGTVWYGLKLWYRGEVIGEIDTANRPIIGNSSKRIARDSALQLAIPKGATYAEITWLADGSRNTTVRRPNTCYYFLEIIYFKADNEFKRDLYPDCEGTSLKRIPKITTAPTFQGETHLRIKPWDMDFARYSIVFKDNDGRLVNFDNQVTYIESTGQVGKAKRKLRIGIDRSTGTILESQDFLLFSGGQPLVIP